MPPTRSVAMLSVILVIGACQPDGGPDSRVSAAVTPAAEATIIRDLSQGWDDAMRAGDVDRLVSLYTTDAVIYEPGLSPVSGTEGLRDHFEELTALDIRTMETDIREVVVAASADLAFETGVSHWEWMTPEGLMVEHGPYVVIWRKEDGMWRIAREIFNSDQASSEPELTR